ncbi:MAG: CBS domain-containing protein, partial [Planctomycetota bacterium]
DQIMSCPVESIPPDISVLRASEIMAEKCIRRLPVVQEDELVGIVTQTDLVRSLTSYGLWKDISEVTNRNVACIQTAASVAEAAKIMTAQKTSCIVALDGDEAVGVLTEKDMLRRVVALKRDPARIMMRDVMSSPQLLGLQRRQDDGGDERPQVSCYGKQAVVRCSDTDGHFHGGQGQAAGGRRSEHELAERIQERNLYNRSRRRDNLC